MIAVEHVAGMMGAEGVQRCSRCGAVLIDYRGTFVLGETLPGTRHGGWSPGPVYRVGEKPGNVLDTVTKPDDFVKCAAL
jgi:hypothetical protein